MIPVRLDGAEVRTLKNNTTGDQLSVIAARGMVFSSWRFSAEELAAVARGKPVWLVIRGELIPEITMTVGDRNEVVPPEIIKRAQRQDAILKTPEAEAVISKNKRESWLIEAIAWGYLAVGVSVLAGLTYYIIHTLVVGFGR